MKSAAFLAALALASCGAPQPQNATAPQPVAVESSLAAPTQRSIGTTSGLTGQTSALKGAVTDFSVTVTETATVVALAADTLFDFDKADLAPAAIANLERTAELVRQGAAGTVVVSGYTDAKGDDSYNQTLSEQRAQAVVNWLRQRPGLEQRGYSVVGKGEASPVAPNAKPDGSDDPEGRARNRRVEVSIPRG